MMGTVNNFHKRTNNKNDPGRHKKYKSNHEEAISISFIYAFFGILWITLSDNILEQIITNIEIYKKFQTYKGWLYIFVTTLMLYLLP